MRRHRFDALSFLAGTLFAALGLAFLFGRIDVTDLRLSWVWPIPLIALGLLMLLTSRRRDQDEIPAQDVSSSQSADLEPERDHEDQRLDAPSGTE